MKVKKLLFVFALILSAALILNVSCGGGDDDDDDDDDEPSPWIQQIVDSGIDIGLYNDLAVDKNGDAHIAYWDPLNMAAMYATNKSGFWESEALPDPIEKDVEGPTAIAVDGSDTIHMVYCSAGLVYAVKPGSDWNTPQNLDAEADCSDEIDLAVTPAGDAHISYTTTSGAVKWYFVGSTNATIDESGSGSAIAVSELGSVFVSYRKSDGLYYATTQGAGGFVPEQIDSGAVGQNSAIAFDGTIAHIVYYDKGNGNLKYAASGTGDWVISVLDNKNDVGQVPAIVIDSYGALHISYYGAPALYYATNFGGIWEFVPADTKVGSGTTDTSIAVDDEGYVHFSYYDINDQLLKYSVSREPQETIEQ